MKNRVLVCACLLLALGLAKVSFGQINPVEVGNLNEYPGYSPQNPAYTDQDVLLWSNYMFVANVRGTFIYDMSNPLQPQRLSVASTRSGGPLTLSGNLLFQANNTSGLEIISITNVTAPVLLIDTNLPGGNAQGVAVAGNYAYLADQNLGLCIFDISNPAVPMLLGQTNTSSQDEAVALSGHYAYVSTFIDGLHVFDVSNPTHPTQVGRVDTGGNSLSGYQMAIRGNYLYLADAWDGLHIYDISNPSNPTSVGRVKVGQYAQHVAVAGNYAYVVEFYTGLRICDISNPANPILLPGTNNNYGAYSYSLALASNYVFLANGGDGLRIYSLSTPVPPLLSMNLNGANVRLSWPAPSAPFELQQSPTLSGTNWAAMTNIPTFVGDQNQIVLPASTNTVFYRLKFP